MSYRNAARELSKNIQIIDNSFEANNLQVLGASCIARSDDEGDLYVFVELATISGSTINNSVWIKINLYDNDNHLYMTCRELIWDDKFSGYDTIEIDCYDNGHVLDTASKMRLFCVKA